MLITEVDGLVRSSWTTKCKVVDKKWSIMRVFYHYNFSRLFFVKAETIYSQPRQNKDNFSFTSDWWIPCSVASLIRRLLLSPSDSVLGWPWLSLCIFRNATYVRKSLKRWSTWLSKGWQLLRIRNTSGFLWRQFAWNHQEVSNFSTVKSGRISGWCKSVKGSRADGITAKYTEKIGQNDGLLYRQDYYS